LGYKIRISNLLAQMGEVEDKLQADTVQGAQVREAEDFAMSSMHYMHGMSPAKRQWQQRVGTLDEERREREHSRAVQKISSLEIQLTESKELVAMREAELEAIRQSQQVPVKKAENPVASYNSCPLEHALAHAGSTATTKRTPRVFRERARRNVVLRKPSKPLEEAEEEELDSSSSRSSSSRSSSGGGSSGLSSVPKPLEQLEGQGKSAESVEV
jgi:hypothetical protein